MESTLRLPGRANRLLKLSVAGLLLSGCSSPNHYDDISHATCHKGNSGGQVAKRFNVNIPHDSQVVRCRIVKSWDGESLSLTFDGDKHDAESVLENFGYELDDLRWSDRSVLWREDQWGVDTCFTERSKRRCSGISFQDNQCSYVVIVGRGPTGAIRVSLDAER
jgi:hypothetical protein